MWKAISCYIISTIIFSFRPGEKQEARKKSVEETTDDVLSVMRTSLTRNEFASAMGMRPSNVFVRKMFRIVDKDGDGMISFQEFLDTVVLFSTAGRSDDKLRIIFDMCDTNENELIEKDELQASSNDQLIKEPLFIAYVQSSMPEHCRGWILKFSSRQLLLYFFPCQTSYCFVLIHGWGFT